MATHTIFGGKVHLYKRPNSSFWQCSTYLAGRNRRVSTKQESLELAKEFAEDWYLSLRDKNRSGALISEKTFRQAAAVFEREYEIITEGQRSPRWVEGHKARLRLHLIPFFGSLGLSQVTAGKAQEYRIHRIETSPESRPPARSTIHDEIVTLRQVLKTALRHGWLAHLPDLSPPYKTQGKVTHRAWFSHKEYKQLYQATRKRARNPLHKRYKWHAEQLHDYVLFMANTGMRPDEARNLQHRDVEIVTDDWSGDKILEIEVRGKRGVGYCMSTSGAVRPYERVRDRPRPERTRSGETEAAGDRLKALTNGLKLVAVEANSLHIPRRHDSHDVDESTTIPEITRLPATDGACTGPETSCVWLEHKVGALLRRAVHTSHRCGFRDRSELREGCLLANAICDLRRYRLA